MTLVTRLGLLRPPLTNYLYHSNVLALTVIIAFRRFIFQEMLGLNP